MHGQMLVVYWGLVVARESSSIGEWGKPNGLSLGNWCILLVIWVRHVDLHVILGNHKRPVCEMQSLWHLRWCTTMCPPSISKPPTLKTSRKLIRTRNLSKHFNHLSLNDLLFLVYLQRVFASFITPGRRKPFPPVATWGEVATASWALAAERLCGDRFISYLRLCREATNSHWWKRGMMSKRMKIMKIPELYKESLISILISLWMFFAWKGGITNGVVNLFVATLLRLLLRSRPVSGGDRTRLLYKSTFLHLVLA